MKDLFTKISECRCFDFKSDFGIVQAVLCCCSTQSLINFNSWSSRIPRAERMDGSPFKDWPRLNLSGLGNQFETAVGKTCRSMFSQSSKTRLIDRFRCRTTVSSATKKQLGCAIKLDYHGVCAEETSTHNRTVIRTAYSSSEIVLSRTTR